jgi:2-dehydro-3-deoxyphosphogluconate aldolase / (4S)-4-hydroxy-2-oxoglutarate aldolase
MTQVAQAISEYGAVPVIVLDSPGQAKPLGDALAAGGLPVAEITFRSPAAAEGISRMSRECPNMIVGAGTVASVAQAGEAVAAGAAFIVTPGFNAPVVDYCITNGIPIFPGISSTGDLEQALARNLAVVKFFPAEAAGGVKMLKALCGPYPHVRFMPTGGISLANIHSYLSLPQVVACGGSWIVPQDALREQAWGRITEIARRTMEEIIGFSVTESAIELPVRYPDRVHAYLQRRSLPASSGLKLHGNRIIVPYGSS